MASSPFDYPIDANFLLQKKHQLKEELSQQENLLEKKIAVLGGSTTAEVVDQLELFLLAAGIRPAFYQSEYNQYVQEAIAPSDALTAFKPDLVYLHTSTANIDHFPEFSDSVEEVEAKLQQQVQHFVTVWDGVEKHLSCPVIQNNFELPWQRPLGNLDGSDYRGRTRFVTRLNEALVQEADKHSGLTVFDLHYLASRMGLDNWASPRIWYLYKYAMNLEMIPHFAYHLSAVMAALWGQSRKCLVTDLDNTLWGGVIGDEGVEGLAMGQDSAEGEAYNDYQQYLKDLQARGIILAVASKNDEQNAVEGLEHPDCLLKADDFSAKAINWEPKFQNLQIIAQQLNIGEGSLVFVDDNPVERDSVQAQLPAVAVPNVGGDISDFVMVLDRSALFESGSFSTEDLARSQHYRDNAQRVQQRAQFDSYDDYLSSLQMKAEVAAFASHEGLYLERISQLINKTNQFNLTTRRVNRSEVGNMADSAQWITLYGRLEDKFGDNGLVAVMAGEIQGKELVMDLWLMSCRVLKRGLEFAMFDQLLKAAHQAGIQSIKGVYIPSPKNHQVQGLYKELGFKSIQAASDQSKDKEGAEYWRLDLSEATVPDYFIELV